MGNQSIQKFYASILTKWRILSVNSYDYRIIPIVYDLTSNIFRANYFNNLIIFFGYFICASGKMTSSYP